jgi:hypothetical protein
MTDPVYNWLGAYIDGELHGERLQQVEAHLADCAECQVELRHLQILSAALKDAALPEEFSTPEHFTARVMLTLPRQKLPAFSQREISQNNLAAMKLTSWFWLAPAAILIVWVFVQAVLLSGWVVSGANGMGLLGNLSSYLAPNPLGGWFSSGISLLDGKLSESSKDLLQVLQQGEQLGWQVFLSFIIQATLVLLFWSSMAGWWIIHQQENS